MKAAVLNKANQPLAIAELKMPQPRAGEILIKVAACGACHSDLHVIKDELKFPTPCVLGHEISGVVAELGPGTKGLRVGDQVVSSFIMPCGTCYHCLRGEEDICEAFMEYNRGRGTLYDGETRLFRPDGSPVWMYSMGGLAEYCVVPATDVFPLPEGLPLADAAIVGCAIFTAYGAVRNAADLRGGESVAVVATGGVGSSIIQIARAFGAGPIIAIDITEEKLEAARDLGATHTIDSQTEDVVARVKEIAGGRGVDAAFEALGRPETFKTAVEIVRSGGRAVVVGLAPAGVTAEVDITRLVRRKVQIRASYGGRARVDMPAVLALAARGLIGISRPITRRYRLDQAHEAFQALDRGEVVGRAIIEFPG